MNFFGRLSTLFKTSAGEYEINRVVGAIGSMFYIVGTHIFVGVDVILKGREFDVTAYCLAFPGGLGVCVGAIAGAVALKDRGVATAKIIADTGAVPAPPPAGPPVNPDEVKK